MSTNNGKRQYLSSSVGFRLATLLINTQVDHGYCFEPPNAPGTCLIKNYGSTHVLVFDKDEYDYEKWLVERFDHDEWEVKASSKKIYNIEISNKIVTLMLMSFSN